MQFRRGRKAPWVVQVRDEIGAIRTFSFSKRDDAEEAETNLRKIRQRIRAGLEKPRSKILFFDFAADFMKQRTVTHPASTWKPDESKLRRVWLPRFGRRVLATITTQDVEKVFHELMYQGIENARGKVIKISPATRNRHFSLLHKLWEEAIKADYVAINPISKLEILSEKVKTKKIEQWTKEEEAEAYIAAAYSRAHVFGVWAVGQTIAGLRVGESIALKWGDIDDGVITISRTFEAITGEIVDRTKGQGAGGIRTVPLFPRFKEALEAWKAVTPHKASADFVFSQASGAHHTHSQFDYAHEQITERAKVKKIRIHDMRHYFASHAERLGFSAREIQEMLGHEDLETTEIYLNVDKDRLANKGKRIGFGETKTEVREEVRQ